MDVFISNNLPRLIRIRDVGPRIVQKYITTPALYRGQRKFDLRFIVLALPSTQGQFQVLVYKMFWVRVANKPFILGEI